MKKYKLVKNTEGVVRKHSDEYFIKNYLTKDFNENFSLAVSENKSGSHELTKSVASDRAYYFIEADAEFVVDGEEMNVASGDVLFIEKNTEYSFSGSFKAVLINIPAFGIEDDRNVNNKEQK